MIYTLFHYSTESALKNRQGIISFWFAAVFLKIALFMFWPSELGQPKAMKEKKEGKEKEDNHTEE